MADTIRLSDELGEQIRLRQEALGINKSQLAERAGKVREVIYRLETGEDTTASPLLEVLSALRHAMRLEPGGLPTAEAQSFERIPKDLLNQMKSHWESGICYAK